MNNPFNYIPDSRCDEAFKELVASIDLLKESDNPEDVNFCRELEAGKMLGVMVASDRDGALHTLYAFSGQLGSGGFHKRGFVEPVFDYLEAGGYFKTQEADISRQNEDIRQFEQFVLAAIRNDYERAKQRADEEIAEYKALCLISKQNRDAKRATGNPDEEELEELLRQSRFEKAELRRLKKRLAVALEPLTEKLTDANARLAAMKEKRRADSEALQEWLFSNFRLLNARGESKSVGEIFTETPLKIPPSGAGECCAPKLLHAAYLRGWKPIAMAEYWYGKPKGGEVRIHGRHYPACRGKCLPILGWMLQGLQVEPPLGNELKYTATNTEPEILFENEWFCVINKPAGMLSVPGKGTADSVQGWLERRYGDAMFVKVAHRLDQDTSGLLVAAFSQLAFRVIQREFASRRVRKTYVAELEGDYTVAGIARSGRIELPLLPDWLDRPRQRVDFEEGKQAISDYEFIDTSHGRSRIEFHPLTGRTHQLRVHAASADGLGMPIAGDSLYGNRTNSDPDRMLLHAARLEFTFPIDRRHYIFESPAPF